MHLKKGTETFGHCWHGEIAFILLQLNNFVFCAVAKTEENSGWQSSYFNIAGTGIKRGYLVAENVRVAVFGNRASTLHNSYNILGSWIELSVIDEYSRVVRQTGSYAAAIMAGTVRIMAPPSDSTAIPIRKILKAVVQCAFTKNCFFSYLKTSIGMYITHLCWIVATTDVSIGQVRQRDQKEYFERHGPK